ncbi:hypothetical protein C3L33_05502, partial [Rhododendron williamsianum]
MGRSICDQENVVGLVASGLGLSGLIPDTTIGKLEYLEYLDLSNNNITGLPSDFWSLGSLKSLNLSSNQLSQTLPSNIGNFGLLETLDLSSNNFSGGIPDAFGSLLSLQLIGTLPTGFFAAFPKLKSLNIAGNGIQGRDLDFEGIGSTSVTYLNISRNSFQGPVIGVFQEPLEVIDLSQNQFQGHISQVNFSSSFNWSNLVYLDLSQNHLSGVLFSNLSEAQNLKHLNLAYNRFSAQPFPEISMLFGLEYLNLSGTKLIGPIPSEISELTSLETLDLSQNQLVSQIPLISTKNLQILDVSYNNLSGSIPISLLGRLPLMEMFNFSYNNLTLCASGFSPETIQEAFIGSVNSCPIAANPDLFRRKPHQDNGFKLALALTVSLVYLLSATSHFDRGTLLAEGRFGPVYRGFLPSGIHVAVKVLVHGSTMTDPEAARELEYLGRIKHPNLVPLTGYCLAGDQRIALYDYMENGNLQNLLHDLPLGVQTTEDWTSDTWEEEDNNGIQNVGLVRKNQGSRAIDPKIRGTGSDKQMEEALKIGYLCTADLPSKRPSMQQVVGILKDIESISNQ